MREVYKNRCAIRKSEKVREFLIENGFKEENKHMGGDYYLTVHRWHGDDYLYSSFVPINLSDINTSSNKVCDDFTEFVIASLEKELVFSGRKERIMYHMKKFCTINCIGIKDSCCNEECEGNCLAFERIIKNIL